MKYLIVLGFIFLTANLVTAQIAEGKEYKYMVTFESNTFDGEEVCEVVSSFREHIFSSTNSTFDFKTRYDKSGVMYFETTFPVSESSVKSYFQTKNKTYLDFCEEIRPFSVYSFNTSM